MTKTEEMGSILDEYHVIFKPLPPTLPFILEMFEGCLIFTHIKVIKQKDTYMWTRQQLLHDVSIINLSTSTKAIFLILKLFIFFYLDG